MKIYNIKEIVEATNSIFNLKKNKSINGKPKPKVKKVEKPLILKAEEFIEDNIQTKLINNKTNIKTEAKDHMINELYFFMKKKVKKNTLKLIIEEQIEIKNLKGEIVFLKKNKENLIQNYNILKQDYDSLIENYKNLKFSNEDLILQNANLKISNESFKNKLNDITQKYEGLSIQNTQLINGNNSIKSNLDLFYHENKKLVKENYELKNTLKKTNINLQENNQKNRSFEINNAELKNTISRYIVNSKKLQEQLNLVEQNKSRELDEINRKVKFYQDENVRLSGELLLYQKNNETIKINLTDIEKEKLKISNKIRELSESIEQKTNVVETNFLKENLPLPKNDIDKLNHKEQKSLDEVISRIFKKI